MKKLLTKKNRSAKQRAARTRKSILRGANTRPRLSVFRTAKHMYAQIINDETGTTLAASSDKHVDAAGKKPVEIAALIGSDIASKAKEAGVSKVVFDRGSYKYHGRVRALAEAAREAGLEF